MGTRPSDWPDVAALCDRSHTPRTLRPAYGVHPWYVNEVVDVTCDYKAAGGGGEAIAVEGCDPADQRGEGDDSGCCRPPRRALKDTPSPTTEHPNAHAAPWLVELERRLCAEPRAVVGEIGLDHYAKVPGTDMCAKAAQAWVWEAQLALAARLVRPVSVHCVHAGGVLLLRLRRAAVRHVCAEDVLPPTMALHAYTGSAELAQQLARLPHGVGKRLYFGFSAVINLRARPHGTEDKASAKARVAIHVRQVLAALPRSQVLLESDQSRVRPVDKELTQMCGLIADVWNATPKQVAILTAHNAERWLAGLPAEDMDDQGV